MNRNPHIQKKNLNPLLLQPQLSTSINKISVKHTLECNRGTIHNFPFLFQGRDGHLQPGGQNRSRSPSPAFGRRSSLSPPHHGRSQTPINRSHSPHRHHDNFTDAVSGMLEFVHEKHENKRRGRSRGQSIQKPTGFWKNIFK